MAEEKADEAVQFESPSLNLICIDSSKHSQRALECKTSTFNNFDPVF